MLTIRFYNAVFPSGLRVHVKVARNSTGTIIYRIYTPVAPNKRKLP